jgi:NADPH:quinone reductase-like Zn-dependent oxidoreductase
MGMRAIWITKPGGPGALEVRETADPEPRPGQVGRPAFSGQLN